MESRLRYLLFKVLLEVQRDYTYELSGKPNPFKLASDQSVNRDWMNQVFSKIFEPLNYLKHKGVWITTRSVNIEDAKLSNLDNAFVNSEHEKEIPNPNSKGVSELKPPEYLPQHHSVSVKGKQTNLEIQDSFRAKKQRRDHGQDDITLNKVEKKRPEPETDRAHNLRVKRRQID